MPRGNVQIVRQAVESVRSDDLEARIEGVLALWDPSCEYTSAMAALEPATYHGHDGIRRYVSDLGDRWAQWRAEVEEVFDVTPDTVVATFRFHCVGKDSGVPIQARRAAVFLLSGGKVVRARTYLSREEALEAAGLEDSESNAAR